MVEWRLYEIPVMPFGYDHWYDGWDSLTESASYLLYMSHSWGNEDYATMRDEFADIYPDHIVQVIHGLMSANARWQMAAAILSGAGKT